METTARPWEMTAEVIRVTSVGYHSAGAHEDWHMGESVGVEVEGDLAPQGFLTQ